MIPTDVLADPVLGAIVIHGTDTHMPCFGELVKFSWEDTLGSQ